MQIAQTVSSMVLGLRRKVNIKVRQPLQKMMIPIPEPGFEKKFDAVKNLILSEVNVKEVEFLTDTAGVIKKKIKLLKEKYNNNEIKIANKILMLE